MQKQDSIAAAQTKKSEKVTKTTKKVEKDSVAVDSTALFFAASNGQDSKVTLKNSKIEVVLSTKGGTIEEARILNFADRKGGKDVTLFNAKEQQMKFMLAGKKENIISSDLYFEAQDVTDKSVTMVADAGNGGSLTIKYVLGDDYLIKMDVATKGLSGIFAPDQDKMTIDWSDLCRQQEKGYMFENRYASLMYKESNGGSDYLSETSEKIDELIEEQLDWVSFRNQFFSAVLISKDGFAKNSMLTSIPQTKESEYLKQYKAKLQTAFDPTGAKASEFEIYIGPNDFHLLQDINEESSFGKDLELEDNVYLGWWIFRFINRWLTLNLFDALRAMAVPMGIILILITLFLKLITYPAVKKSYMSSAKMRVLRPKLNALTAKYDKPEDAMKKQAEMMQLYSQYGVSPMGGCLPMLIQMPIWLAMFNFVPNAIQLRGASFLWMEDLSTYDAIITWGTHIWGIGDHLSLSCLLFCGANIVYTIFSMRQQKDMMAGTPEQQQQMKMMQWMMYIMPLMFFFMFNDYSSGLNFYYFISLLCSAVIMWALRKFTNDEKLLAQLEANYEKNKANPKKQSGLAARLEAMQRQQEEMERKRQELRNRRLGK